MGNTPVNAGRDQAGRFTKGHSGNPAGKPPGCRHNATKAAEALLDGEARALTRKAIERALQGDVGALRLCMERLLPPRRDRPIEVDLPALESPKDLSAAMAEVSRALGHGGTRHLETG